jgi:ectoine hydroxylase
MKDYYPTRSSKNYSILNRIDKVAYRKPKNLSKKDYEFYKENGFLILRGFFKDKDMLRAKKECYNMYENPSEYYTNKEPFCNKVRSILSVHHNKNISHLLDKNLRNMAESILGDEVYIHQSRINYKSGKDSNGWNWHSDFETWHAKDGMPRMRCLTAMIAVDKNTKENGCLNFIPKSHTKYISCPLIGDLNPEEEFSEQIEGVPDKKSIEYIKNINKVDLFECECESGDLILFDSNTLHYSGKNTTNTKRTNLYFVFNSKKNKLVKPFNSKQHRPIEMGTLI